MPDPLNSNVELVAQLVQLLGVVTNRPLLEKHMQLSA